MQPSHRAVSGATGVVPPSPIIETTFAFAQSCALLAAVELELFTHIAHGNETSKQLAQAAHVDESALLRLLGTLCAMDFLQQTTSATYTLTPLSERYLVADRTTYIGAVALQIRQEWEAWIQLTDIIRTGRPFRHVNEEPLGGRFFEPLAESLFPLLYPLMRQVCERLDIGRRFHKQSILDLGAGTAPAAIAALECDAGAHAVAVDFAPVLERARAYAQKHGVAERMRYWPTALETLDLPDAAFDLAFASHIFRIVGAELTRTLMAQCFRALKPGGRLVIVETYNEPEQQHKLFPHIVALNMLVNTRSGDAFSSEQVREWLQEAGFQVEAWHNLGADPILIATHPLDQPEQE